MLRRNGAGVGGELGRGREQWREAVGGARGEGVAAEDTLPREHMLPLDAAVAMAHEPQQRGELAAAQRVHELAPRQRHELHGALRLAQLAQLVAAHARARRAGADAWRRGYVERRRAARVRDDRGQLGVPLAHRTVQ